MGTGVYFSLTVLQGFDSLVFWGSHGFDREALEVLCISEIIEWGSR